ncbi:MAG: hypothetical protein VXW87_02455 [Pseudomonadota bacterium]|nr:hypothetical protein [Pseudomonadota bacterium]
MTNLINALSFTIKVIFSPFLLLFRLIFAVVKFIGQWIKQLTLAIFYPISCAINSYQSRKDKINAIKQVFKQQKEHSPTTILITQTKLNKISQDLCSLCSRVESLIAKQSIPENPGLHSKPVAKPIAQSQIQSQVIPPVAPQLPPKSSQQECLPSTSERLVDPLLAAIRNRGAFQGYSEAFSPREATKKRAKNNPHPFAKVLSSKFKNVTGNQSSLIEELSDSEETHLFNSV